MKITKTSLVIAFGGLLFSGVTFAQVVTPTTETAVSTTMKNEQSQQKVQALAEKKQALVLKKCENVAANLGKRVSNSEKNKIKHVESFVKTYTKISALVARLTSDGYDTSKLATDLATMDSMIKKFESDYSLYNTSLKDSQGYACDQEEAAFRVKLNDSKSQLKLIREQSVAIRTFWAKTIKQDILEIKSQKTTDSTEATTEEAR